MRIIEQTSNKLTLRKNNYGIKITGVFVGSISLFLGLILILSPRFSSFECKRVQPTQGSCQLVNSNLLWSSEKQIPLNQLKGAKVDVSQDSEGENTYNVTLLTQQEDIPLSLYSSSDADQINAFIGYPAKTSLSLKIDLGQSSYFMGVILMLFGGLALLTSLLTKFTQTYIFDKDQGLMNLEERALFGSKVKDYKLQEINLVEAKEKTDIDGDKTYCVRLNLISGERIVLSSYSTGKEQQQKMAESISQFLNLKA
jgi:hypothetical protein